MSKEQTVSTTIDPSPPPPPRGITRGPSRLSIDALKPGEAVYITNGHLDSIRQHAYQARKEHPGSKYEVHKLAGGKIGVWRTA